MKKQSPLMAPSLARDATLTVGVEAGMEIVLDSPHATDKTFLCDLSAIRKRLVVGRGAAACLGEHIQSVPEKMFVVEVLPENALAIRIHRQQWLLIDGYQSSRYDELFMMPTGAHGEVLLLDYECTEIAVGGPQVGAIMSELCPLPLHDLQAQFWCATRMAHTDVVVIANDTPKRHYRVLTTPADARFVYAILLDTLQDLGGAQIGFEQYWQYYRG